MCLMIITLLLQNLFMTMMEILFHSWLGDQDQAHRPSQMALILTSKHMNHLHHLHFLRRRYGDPFKSMTLDRTTDEVESKYVHRKLHSQKRVDSLATHHEVAEIFEIIPPPDDLDAVHVQPLLLVQHDDVLFGDNRRAVLIDVQLHGSNFDSTVEIDRYTTMLPSPIHRSALLKFAGVAQYCHVSMDRCLLWHRGQLIPFQATNTLVLAHGDYIKDCSAAFSN